MSVVPYLNKERRLGGAYPASRHSIRLVTPATVNYTDQFAGRIFGDSCSEEIRAWINDQETSLLLTKPAKALAFVKLVRTRHLWLYGACCHTKQPQAHRPHPFHRLCPGRKPQATNCSLSRSAPSADFFTSRRHQSNANSLAHSANAQLHPSIITDSSDLWRQTQSALNARHNIYTKMIRLWGAKAVAYLIHDGVAL